MLDCIGVRNFVKRVERRVAKRLIACASMSMVDGFDLSIIRFSAAAFEATSININNNNNFQA